MSAEKFVRLTYAFSMICILAIFADIIWKINIGSYGDAELNQLTIILFVFLLVPFRILYESFIQPEKYVEMVATDRKTNKTYVILIEKTLVPDGKHSLTGEISLDFEKIDETPK